jgi:hypothetical protein
MREPPQSVARAKSPCRRLRSACVVFPIHWHCSILHWKIQWTDAPQCKVLLTPPKNELEGGQFCPQPALSRLLECGTFGDPIFGGLSTPAERCTSAPEPSRFSIRPAPL